LFYLIELQGIRKDDNATNCWTSLFCRCI